MKFKKALFLRTLGASLFFIALTIKLFSQESYHIPAQIPTISEAVQAAQDGDTLYISSGLYTDSVQIRNKELVIIGQGDTPPLFSPTPDQASAFDVKDAKVQFWNLAFTDLDQQTSPPNIGINAYNADLLVQHCSFDQLFTPMSLFMGNLQVSHSIFTNTRGSHAITLNLGTFLIHNNLIAKGDYQGIFINRSHGHIFNNTMIGTATTEHFGIIINSDSITHIFNNIITNFGIGIVNLASDSTELNALRIDHNNIYETAAPYRYEYNESLNFPIYYGDLIPNPGTGEIHEPALFLDPNQGNFHLQEGSPCIDAGSDDFPFPVQEDLAGAQRLAGNATDIGAYEWPVPLGGNEGLLSAEVIIYPQPARDWVSVSVEKPFSGQVQVKTMDGKLIKAVEVKQVKLIHLECSIPAGFYLVQLVNQEPFYSQLLIVQ